MIYSFNHIDDEEIYKSSVLMINGKYNIFNNMVIDHIKELYTNIDTAEQSVLMREFFPETNSGSEYTTDGGNLGTDSIDEFMELSGIPSILGKRVCIVDYSMLTKKQIDWVERYIKKPSMLSMLVITFSDFRKVLKYQRSRFISNSTAVNMINLSFPNRAALKRIIQHSLSEYKIEDKAVELFIWRLSDNYEEYADTFNKIKLYEGKHISYEQMKELLVGIDNYNVDDFVRMILNPPRKRKGKPRNIYKALNNLTDDIGARNLVLKVSNALDRIAEMRILMNEGKISAGNGYMLSEAILNKFKEGLPDSSKLKKMSNFALSKYYRLAKQTSMRDIEIARLIIDNSRTKVFTGTQYERILFSLINRCTFRPNRVANDIGMKDTLDEAMYNINSIAVKS